MTATVTAKGPQVDFRRAADVVIARTDEHQPASRFAKLRGHSGKGLNTEAWR